MFRRQRTGHFPQALEERDDPAADVREAIAELVRSIRLEGPLPVGDGFVVDAAKPNGFDRPWSPIAAGEGENDSTIISRPSPPRARDATPSETDWQADE